MLSACAPWLELDSWWCPWAGLELFSSACALDMEPKAACKLELPCARRSLQPVLHRVEEHRTYASITVPSRFRSSQAFPLFSLKPHVS